MDTEYLNRFEERLQQELLRLCTDYHVLDGTLLATEDLDNRWHDLAPEYVADAVEQGASTFKEVKKMTKAGKACGDCKKKVKKLIKKLS